MEAPTILIVDDDADMRLYLRGCLRGLGGGEPGDQAEAVGRVLEAANGEEALQTLCANHVDLVISDVILPRLDGRALLAAIRRRPEWDRLPVLLISGEDPAESDDSPGSWLPKPFNARQLLVAVTQLLATPRQ